MSGHASQIRFRAWVRRAGHPPGRSTSDPKSGDVEFVVEISRCRAPLHRSTTQAASSRGGCRALQLYSAPALHLYSSTALYTLHPLHPPSGWGQGWHALRAARMRSLSQGRVGKGGRGRRSMTASSTAHKGPAVSILFWCACDSTSTRQFAPVSKERKKENRQPKGGMGGRHAATTQGF